MKKYFTLAIGLLFSLELLSQVTPVGRKFTTKTKYDTGKLKANKEFVIDTVRFDDDSYEILYTQDGKKFSQEPFIYDIEILTVDNNLGDYWFTKNFRTLKPISGIKDLFSIRAQIEEEANQYVSFLYRTNSVFDDPYLEHYLYSVISKITPTIRPDGFKHDIRLLLVDDPSMNASAWPNGVMTVNTGLLAQIHTEDQLVAVLSHEMGHFIANHTLFTIREEQKAQKRAEFWSGLATGIAAATEIAASATGHYYGGGRLTYSVAEISHSVSSELIKRTGMNYSRRQEEEADKMAMEALKYLGYDKNAAASVFKIMADVYNEEGNWDAYYLSGDHPSLEERIKYSGQPSDKVDPEFEKIVSFAVTNEAIRKYNTGRFSQALRFVNQNIKNHVATDDDYLIKARCLLSLYNDSEHNKESFVSIQKAKEINAMNANILRTEVIAVLRLKDFTSAGSLLKTYMLQLEESMGKKTDKTESYQDFLNTEYNWARSMAVKVKGLSDK